MLVEPPDAVTALVGSPDGWVDVEPSNEGPGRTWLTTDHAIKAVPIERAAELDRAAEHAAWLSVHVPTAETVLRVDGGEVAWSVSGRLPGVPAHRPDLHGDVGSLAEVTGDALRRLHAVPVASAPDWLEWGWVALEALAEASVAQGIGSVDEPYQRYSPDELLEMWRQGRPTTEDLVICHGDPALPNLLAHQGRFTGFVDLGSVRIADRHLDLAHAHLSVHRNLGPDAVYVFYDSYGADPDLVRLDHYLLAKQLLP